MIKYLQDMECLNVERLFLLKGKQSGLDDREIMILMLIYTFASLKKQMISPLLLLQYSSLSPKEMDQVLDSLIKKKWIYNQSGSIQLNKCIDRLLTEEKPEVKETNLIDIFEENFGRPLTSMDLDIIKDWVEEGFSEEIILKALKEAVKSKILKFRYIDGILKNWKNNGIKERFIEEKPKERKVAVSHYQWWNDE